MARYKRGELLEVIWADASGSAKWECDPTPCVVRVRTVGYFIARNKAGMLLATGLPIDDDDGQYLGASHIPNGMVLKVRKLR